MSDITEKRENPRPARGSGERVRVNLALSASTHRALKVWCTQKGVTLQGGLEKMLDAAVARMVQKEPSGE